MFVADRLIFLELTKTGCTHVNGLLGALIPGKQIGKHNSLASRPANRLVIGSIRNPWDWYVSLWAFGCMRQGGLYHRLTNEQPTHAGFKRFLANDERRYVSEREASNAYRALEHQHAEMWRESYRDGHDVQCFRKWLAFMSDPRHRFDLDDGYGQSAISRMAGLMTFRYLRLFSSERKRILRPNAFTKLDEMKQFDARHNMLQAVIRSEHLEEDFLAAVARAGYELTPTQKDYVFAQRTNMQNQSRRLTTAVYYDLHTMQVVREREALIIEKYGYAPPDVA